MSAEIVEIEHSPGYYVSSDGRVFSTFGKSRWSRPHSQGPKPLKPYRAGAGYLVVALNGVKHYIHRLVAEAFLGECPPGCETLHRDSDKTNNRVDNLRWGTHAENMAEIPRGRK